MLAVTERPDTVVNNAQLAYYAHPGMMTDPRDLAFMFADLPTTTGKLCQVVQQNMLHVFWAERYGRTLGEAEQEPLSLRSLYQKLLRMRTVNVLPLTEPRPLAERQVGNCRDFTLLLVAMLRYQGIPARARCGFAAYFLPDHYEDHWVAEVWNGARWVLVDAQLDALQIDALGVTFDPLDVPREQFIVAGEAWQRCRRGEANPADFGIMDMHGWWFIWGNVVRELLAFNKVEILPWDHEVGFFTHGLEDPLPADGPELAEYDRLAALTTAGDQAFLALRNLYTCEPQLHVPSKWFR
jgi:hypothetical protein